MWSSLCVFFGLLALGASGALAQGYVVTVRLCSPEDARFPARSFLPGARFSATRLSLRGLIQIAYDVPYFLISGGPSWMDSARFDVAAKADDERSTKAEMLAMLRELLVERFHLVVKTEIKEQRAYVLVIAKGGPKLTAAKGDCAEGPGCHAVVGGAKGGLNGKSVTLHDVAYMLSVSLELPVEDGTGVDGVFDIRTSAWNPDVGGADVDSSRASLFSVLKTELGLELVRRRVQVRSYVVERAETPREDR